MSIEELDKTIDEILSKAEEEKNKIIASARIRAKEILSKPVPVEEYYKEAEELINQAKLEAEKIMREAESKAEKIRRIEKEKFDKAVELLLDYILGLRSE